MHSLSGNTIDAGSDKTEGANFFSRPEPEPDRLNATSLKGRGLAKGIDRGADGIGRSTASGTCGSCRMKIRLCKSGRDKGRCRGRDQSDCANSQVETRRTWSALPDGQERAEAEGRRKGCSRNGPTESKGRASGGVPAVRGYQVLITMEQ